MHESSPSAEILRIPECARGPALRAWVDANLDAIRDGVREGVSIVLPQAWDTAELCGALRGMAPGMTYSLSLDGRTAVMRRNGRDILQEDRRPQPEFSPFLQSVSDQLASAMTEAQARIECLLDAASEEDRLRRPASPSADYSVLRGACGELILDLLVREAMGLMRRRIASRVVLTSPVFTDEDERWELQRKVNERMGYGWRFEFDEKGCHLHQKRSLRGEYENAVIAEDGEEAAFVFLDVTMSSNHSKEWSAKGRKALLLRTGACLREGARGVRALRIGFTDNPRSVITPSGITFPIRARMEEWAGEGE